MGNDKPRLYVRFPKIIEEELEVKNLCVNIESVRLPRQKSARWCIVEFKTKQDKEEGIKILKNTYINGKRLVVRAAKKKRKTLSFEGNFKSINSIEYMLKNKDN